MRFAFYVLLFLLPVSVHGLDVRFHPGERVYLFESSPERDIHSLAGYEIDSMSRTTFDGLLRAFSFPPLLHLRCEWR